MQSSNKEKIFCIGCGKTGTTSVEKALKDLGYKMGDQAKGELLLEDYINRNFESIISFCKTAEAFQDAPFCFQHTYLALDQYFKNAKFILTVRKNDVVWYNSLTSFHTNLYANKNHLPSWEDLDNATYRFKGYAARVREYVFGVNREENPYHEEKLKHYYNTHNSAVMDYFKNKDNLLVINVSQKGSYDKLCKFLGKTPMYKEFPWENRTSDM